MTESRYKDMLSDLQDILQGNRVDIKPIRMDDAKLNLTVGSQIREQDEEYDNRNRLYTHLLEMYIVNYQRKEKAKRVYKIIFFTVTVFLFVGIVGFGVIGTFRLSVAGDGNFANVGIAITNIAGIVATLIVLPKIIAEHLFPANEESNMLEMVKDMQDNDAKIRNFLYEKREDKIG